MNLTFSRHCLRRDALLFPFPSSPRDVRQDADGNHKEEQSLQWQAPVAVTALCAAYLGDFVKGMPAPTSIFPQSSVQSIVRVEIGEIDG
jgi:hypothetical protein